MNKNKLRYIHGALTIGLTRAVDSGNYQNNTEIEIFKSALRMVEKMQAELMEQPATSAKGAKG